MPRTWRFQSPGRDSGRSRQVAQAARLEQIFVSIPWSGFRSFTLEMDVSGEATHMRFQSPGRDSGRSRAHDAMVCQRLLISFNPLVGIPVVHA